jgi:hypothetical protein
MRLSKSVLGSGGFRRSRSVLIMFVAYGLCTYSCFGRFEAFHEIMAPCLALIASVISLASFTLGQSNYFKNPPDSSTASKNPANFTPYKVGDSLDVAWVTNAAVVDLVVYQSGNPQINRAPNSGKQ